MKVAFCDRDGTLIKDYPDEKWKDIKKPTLFDDTAKTLIKLNEMGYEIIIVTNQYLINEGYITLRQYNSFNSMFLRRLRDLRVRILDVFYCPHRRDEGCNCIKPNTGMIEAALNKYKTIQLDESFVVGNSKVDIDLAKNFDIKSFSLQIASDYYKNTKIDRLEDLLQFI